MGRSCLFVVFSPLDTHVGICTCGIIASWKYRQHPLDLRGFCSVYELETCLDFQRLEKSTLSPCPGDSSTSLAVGALLLLATFCLNTEVPQTHSCPVYLCALPQPELLWAVGCVCVCVRFTEPLQSAASPGLTPCLEELLCWPVMPCTGCCSCDVPQQNNHTSLCTFLCSSGTYVPLIHDKTPCIKINTLGREKLW